MDTLTSLKARPYLLKNKIQPYAWGTRGEEAFIPRFLGIEPEADRPYAELWMGAHPNAPSEIIVEGTPVALPEVIAQHPQEILGGAVSRAFSGKLPFLFKVLSAAEALSIQTHPNKAQAQIMHARDPEHYPDANHKPELAVALDGLTALVGFKPFSELRQTLERYPEIAGFIGAAVAQRWREAGAPSTQEERALLQLLVAALIRRSISHETELAGAIDRLAGRLGQSAVPLTEAEATFLDLRKKYPGADVGLFSIFLLNLVHLGPGQGVFTDAGAPHAYLKGNIVECMASSDNVVRVGLTPKFKDVETLLDVLAYDAGPAPILGGGGDAEEVIYRTPASEFQVSRWTLCPGSERIELTEDRPQVYLITRGQVLVRWPDGEETFHKGQSFLVPAFLETYAMIATTSAELFRVEVPL